MRNPKMLQILRGLEDRYPVELERQFPRILNKIAELWGMPEMSAYFDELLVDSRGNRKGFPPEVVQEIFFLNTLFIQRAGKEPSDIWVLEHSRVEPKKPTGPTIEKKFFAGIEAGDENALGLLNAGVSVNARGEGGVTALIVALFNRHERLALALLGKGADVRAQDGGGHTALHWAAKHGLAQSVKALIERDAEIDARNKWRATPLMFACEQGPEEIVRLLLIAGANTRAADNDGATPLHKAAARGHLTILQSLLDHGADIDSRGKTGSALHSAAASGQAQAAEFLLRRGANVQLRDGDGRTAADVARQNGNKTIERILKLRAGNDDR
jgi:ankyrin repeat protein